jgi:hypothetical protein
MFHPLKDHYKGVTTILKRNVHTGNTAHTNIQLCTYRQHCTHQHTIMHTQWTAMFIYVHFSLRLSQLLENGPVKVETHSSFIHSLFCLTTGP